MKRKPVVSMQYNDWTEEQHRNYLKNHERYQAYYALHNPATIDRFIKEYAAIKYDIFKNIDKYKDDYEQHKMQFLSEADRYIDIILQKKLFNLQCQWRAGLIQLPFVDICADFVYWQHHIRLCPFISPITPEELDLCMDFLKEQIDHSEALFGEYIDWQNYQGFKNHRKLLQSKHKETTETPPLSHYDCVAMPDIYHYFDKAQHTVAYLDLLDIRGKKEETYLSEGIKIKYNLLKEKLKSEGEWYAFENDKTIEETSETRPSLHSFDLFSFVEATEDAEAKEAFRYYNHQRHAGKRKEEDDETNMYFEFLKSFDEPISIEPSDNWRTALAVTARRFKQNKIAEMLPYAYDTHAFEFNGEVNEDKIFDKRVANFKYNEIDHHYRVLMLQKETFRAARLALDGKDDFNYL